MANTKEKLAEKPVADLREMAAKKDIEGRSAMNKDELVENLATDTDLGDGHSGTTSKGEKRLFQSGDDPARKEWLTKAEAEKRGHYWATDQDINSRPGGIRGST